MLFEQLEQAAREQDGSSSRQCMEVNYTGSAEYTVCVCDFLDEAILHPRCCICVWINVAFLNPLLYVFISTPVHHLLSSIPHLPYFFSTIVHLSHTFPSFSSRSLFCPFSSSCSLYILLPPPPLPFQLLCGASPGQWPQQRGHLRRLQPPDGAAGQRGAAAAAPLPLQRLAARGPELPE